MARIKITVKDLDQANEIIEYWNKKDVELLVDVKTKETITVNDKKEIIGYRQSFH